MNHVINTFQSLAMLGLLSIAVSASAGNRGTETPIRSCVAEIARQANYADASKVVHWITQLEQKNLVEIRIGIKTEVFAVDSDLPVRQYSSSCVAGALGDIVEFSLDAEISGTD